MTLPVLLLERSLRKNISEFNPIDLSYRQIQFRLGKLLSEIWAEHYNLVVPKSWIQMYGNPVLKVKWHNRRGTYVSGLFVQPICQIYLPKYSWNSHISEFSYWKEISDNIISIICHEFIHVLQCVKQYTIYKKYSDPIPRVDSNWLASYLSIPDEIEAWAYCAAIEVWKAYQGDKESIIKATKRLYDRNFVESSFVVSLYHSKFSDRNDPFIVSVWVDFLKFVRHHVSYYSITKDCTWSDDEICQNHKPT